LSKTLSNSKAATFLYAESRRTMNIVLIGFKNSGKTTIGKLLAQQRHQLFIDTDQLIEENYERHMQVKLTIQEILQQYGEPYFRSLEKKAISSLANKQQCVIATGGGAILDDNNIACLKKNGLCIYLLIPYKKLAASLPLYLGKPFAEIYARRKDLYLNAANIVIDTQAKKNAEIVHEILARFE
jgi:shikimate kinase